MSKNYQKKAGSAATVADLVIPDVVSLAMADIADGAREGCSPWRWAPACKSWMR